MKKKQAHKLKYKPDFEFALLGISSHENDYHLSWSLNQALDMSFTRVKDLSVEVAPGETMSFSVYRYEDPDALTLYHLISNVAPDGFLIPELKNMDFFLQVFGETAEVFQRDLADRINRIPIINACFPLDANNLRSSHRLLFT